VLLLLLLLLPSDLIFRDFTTRLHFCGIRYNSSMGQGKKKR
jgi:hypothetical protein